MARKQPDWRNPRPNETIGGGFFVFRRGDSTGRIRMAEWPFEHASAEAAQAEARRLAGDMPGYQFDVLQVVGSAMNFEIEVGAYSDDPHPDDEAELRAEAADAEHERRRERRAGI